MKEYYISVDPRFKYNIAIFVLKDKKEFKSFLKNKFPKLEYENNGVAFYIGMEKYENNWFGSMFFDERYLSIGTINHECLHCALDWIGFKKKFDIFGKESHEEYLAYLQELLCSKICKKLKINKIINISYKELDRDFKYSAKVNKF